VDAALDGAGGYDKDEDEDDDDEEEVLLEVGI
jgi:hypothetical protein